MIKKFVQWSLPLIVIFFSLSIFAQAEGPQQTYFGYIIPAASEIHINDEIFQNEDQKSSVHFKEAEEEVIKVDGTTKGVRILSKAYSVDVNAGSTLQFDSFLKLQAGSIHVTSKEDLDEAQKILLGDLLLSFHSAEFLSFISEDQSQSIIKVIEGQVEVENPATEQTATLDALQATSTDEEGRLLIPFPIELNEKGWWEDKAYQSEYDNPPIADAGDDQRVLLDMAITLNGSRSEFRTGDIFEWKLIGAPLDSSGKAIDKVAFNTINIVKPLFTPKVKGEYEFSLQITDGKGVKSNISTVTIYVGKEFLKPVDIFPDVPAEHPNNLAITYLYKKNVMTGSPDAETDEVLFRPESTINRVEILKTVFENLQETVPSKEEIESIPEDERFDDVKSDHWFAPYVYFAKEKGIVKGNDGLYRPADEVLLGEAMKIIVESTGVSIDAYKELTNIPYPDAEAGAWYNPYLFFIKKYELFDADEKGNINPGKALTRAEFAEIIYRLESRNLQEKKGFVSGKILQKKTKEGIENAEVFIYETIENTEHKEGQEGFISKGDLFQKVAADENGKFTIPIPIHKKFYLEGVTEDNVSVNKVIIQVGEDEVKNVELQIETE